MRYFVLLLIAGLAACTPTHKPTSTTPNSLHTPLSNRSWLFYSIGSRNSKDHKKIVSVEIRYRENQSRQVHSPAVPISANHLAAFQAARRTGSGMEGAIVDLATRVARLTRCQEGSIELAPHTTRYSVPPGQFANVLGSDANIPRANGTAIPVPPVKAHAAGGTVRLTCNLTKAELAKAAAHPVISPSQLRSRAAGRTHRSYSPAHGTQIEYLSPNGTAYLWYPGNSRPVLGDWQIEPNNSNPSEGVICFAYRRSYNPVSGVRGGRHCLRATTFIRQHSVSRQGDIFNLSSGRIPYVMPKRELSFDALARRRAP